MGVKDPALPAINLETTDKEEYNKFKTDWESEELAQVKVRVLSGHTKSVNRCLFLSEDKTRVLSASSDGTVKTWQTETAQCAHTYHCHDAVISYMDSSDDRTLFLTASWDKSIGVWDTQTGKNIWRHRHKAISQACAMSPDGKLAASASDVDYTLYIWSVDSGKAVHTKKGYHSSAITHLSFDPTSTRLVTSSIDGITRVFDCQSGETTVTLQGHAGVVAHSQFDTKGAKIVTCGWDKTLCVWDVSTGLYRRDGPQRFLNGHEGSISSCLLNGNMLISSSYDQTIAVWDYNNATVKLTLKGHDDWIHDVVMSKDQKWLLSASKDRKIRLWNIEDSDRLKYMSKSSSVGLKVATCLKCKKPFSLSQEESADVSDDFKKFCFFCRIHYESTTVK